MSDSSPKSTTATPEYVHHLRSHRPHRSRPPPDAKEGHADHYSSQNTRTIISRRFALLPERHAARGKPSRKVSQNHFSIVVHRGHDWECDSAGCLARDRHRFRYTKDLKSACPDGVSHEKWNLKGPAVADFWVHTTSARIRVLGNNARSDPRSTRRASTVRRVAGSGRWASVRAATSTPQTPTSTSDARRTRRNTIRRMRPCGGGAVVVASATAVRKPVGAFTR